MNKEISIKKFGIILSCLVALELSIFLIIFNHNYQILKSHCQVAVCNDDATICYNFDLDGDDTIVTWKGSCTKVKLK